MTTTVAARRAPWQRLSVGHVVMIGAGLAGAVLTLLVLGAADDSVRVARSRHDLVAGQRLTDDDVEFAPIDAPTEIVDGLVRAGEPIEGLIVSAPVPAGELLSRRSLGEEAASDGLRAMSIPVDESRAVAGELAPGDRVDVLSVVDGASRYAVTDAEVLGVDRPQRGAIGAGLEGFSVTVAVDDAAALEVARGIQDDSIVLVRSTGATPITTDAP